MYARVPGQQIDLWVYTRFFFLSTDSLRKKTSLKCIKACLQEAHRQLSWCSIVSHEFSHQMEKAPNLRITVLLQHDSFSWYICWCKKTFDWWDSMVSFTLLRWWSSLHLQPSMQTKCSIGWIQELSVRCALQRRWYIRDTFAVISNAYHITFVFADGIWHMYMQMYAASLTSLIS